MSLDIEKAQIMWKLAKKNWNNKYDRLEHFKRFPNLKQAVKELENQNLIIVRKKPNYIGISLDSHNKKVIVEFMKSKLPHLKEFIN